MDKRNILRVPCRGSQPSTFVPSHFAKPESSQNLLNCATPKLNALIKPSALRLQIEHDYPSTQNWQGMPNVLRKNGALETTEFNALKHKENPSFLAAPNEISGASHKVAMAAGGMEGRPKSPYRFPNLFQPCGPCLAIHVPGNLERGLGIRGCAWGPSLRARGICRLPNSDICRTVA